jgi:hypothetical protein
LILHVYRLRIVELDRGQCRHLDAFSSFSCEDVLSIVVVFLYCTYFSFLSPLNRSFPFFAGLSAAIMNEERKERGERKIKKS